MARSLSGRSDRVAAVRALLGSKGRREQQRFSFEGPTLLAEALRSDLEVAEIFATEEALADGDLAAMEHRGAKVFVIDRRTAAKISDLETPPGIVGVAAMSLRPLETLLRGTRLVVVLADFNDPGNAGTLLRSAEALGANAAVFGAAGVDPYHPKVVRAAMGTIFRLPLAVADPEHFRVAASAAGMQVVGLSAEGAPLESAHWLEPSALVVGHERRGLGPWSRLCSRIVSVPMSGPTESLNAAVAGSIALYEAGKRTAQRGP